jgi:hypothetical protein
MVLFDLGAYDATTCPDGIKTQDCGAIEIGFYFRVERGAAAQKGLRLWVRLGTQLGVGY